MAVSDWSSIFQEPVLKDATNKTKYYCTIAKWVLLLLALIVLLVFAARKMDKFTYTASYSAPTTKERLPTISFCQLNYYGLTSLPMMSNAKIVLRGSNQSFYPCSIAPVFNITVAEAFLAFGMPTNAEADGDKCLKTNYYTMTDSEGQLRQCFRIESSSEWVLNSKMAQWEVQWLTAFSAIIPDNLLIIAGDLPASSVYVPGSATAGIHISSSKYKELGKSQTYYQTSVSYQTPIIAIYYRRTGTDFLYGTSVIRIFSSASVQTNFEKERYFWVFVNGASWIGGLWSTCEGLIGLFFLYATRGLIRYLYTREHGQNLSPTQQIDKEMRVVNEEVRWAVHQVRVHNNALADSSSLLNL